MRFEPMTIPGLEPRPEWWQVRPAEIIRACNAVTKSRAEVIAITPGGYPVYAVFYGDFPDWMPQTNWSAGAASKHPELFTGAADQPQTLVWCAGIHGGEAESVAASVNLIYLLETGSDLLGRRHERLVELLRHYRLIILPCVNMDGRSICPDHLRKAVYQDFRKASQGTWLDDSLVGWLGSKQYFPLPLDRVSFPGGYPNSEGYNIMHDASPGNQHTAEAKAILRLAERSRVDLLLNAHSCEGEPCLLAPQEVNYQRHIERGFELFHAVNSALYEAGLRHDAGPVQPRATPDINLNTLIPLVSGGMAMVLECCVSLDYSFEQLMDANFVTLEALLRSGLEKPWVDRPALFSGPSA